MKVLVTGSQGFIGKNLVVTLKTMNIETVSVDRNSTYEELLEATSNCDFVFHLAGVNRPTDPQEFYSGNSNFTKTLTDALQSNNNACPILFASSIQALNDSDYGKSKLEAEKVIINHSELVKSKYYIFRLANVYGKWARPNYNSVIATWCYNVARELPITINDPNTVIDFIYIDDVISSFIEVMGKSNESGYYCVDKVDSISLLKLKNTLESFYHSRTNMNVPDVSTRFNKNLYSTYLSYLPIDKFSYDLTSHRDDRGSFTEFLKTDSMGQVSINVSKPGITKGEHWHHTKNEKFLVVSGEGEVNFRSILDNEVITYKVSGTELRVIDIPVGFTHNIVNKGKEDMVTIMWANEKFDPNNPDTYFERVNYEKN